MQKAFQTRVYRKQSDLDVNVALHVQPSRAPTTPPLPGGSKGPVILVQEHIHHVAAIFLAFLKPVMFFSWNLVRITGQAICTPVLCDFR